MKGLATRESSGKVLNAIAAENAVAAWRCGGSGAFDKNRIEGRMLR